MAHSRAAGTRSVRGWQGDYTGHKQLPQFCRTAWEGLDQVLRVAAGGQMTVDISRVRPSFCSAAVYTHFLKTFELWAQLTHQAVAHEVWASLRPYTVQDRQCPVQHAAMALGEWPTPMAQGLRHWHTASALVRVCMSAYLQTIPI